MQYYELNYCISCCTCNYPENYIFKHSYYSIMSSIIVEPSKNLYLSRKNCKRTLFSPAPSPVAGGVHPLVMQVIEVNICHLMASRHVVLVL